MEIDAQTKEQIVEEKKLVFKMNNEIASQVKLSAKGFSRLIKLLSMMVIALVFLVFFVKLFL